MTTCRGAVGEEPLGGRARLGGGVGDLPRRDGQALGDEQRLGVGFLDLHARTDSDAGGGCGASMVARGRRVGAGARFPAR